MKFACDEDVGCQKLLLTKLPAFSNRCNQFAQQASDQDICWDGMGISIPRLCNLQTSTSKAGCRMIATAVCATNDWLKARVLCCRRCRAMFPPLKQAETKIYGCQSGSCTLRTNCHEMGE